MRFATVVALVLLTACSKDASKESSTIAPDPTVDGGKVDPTNPDPTNPDPSAPGADTNISGTRLKRRVLKGTDGSQQFVGFFDTQRNEPCNFLLASDGKQRCVSVSAYVNGYFEDAGCTKPMFFQAKGCVAPTTAYAPTGGASCQAGTPIRVMQIGPLFSGGMAYTGSPASCTGFSSTSLLSAYDIYTTTVEIPPTSFVDATEGHI